MCSHRLLLESMILERMPVFLENDIIIFKALLECWPYGMPRTELSATVKLPRSTVYDALTRLNLAGVVISKPRPRTIKGRSQVVFWAEPPHITAEMWARIMALRPSNQEVLPRGP